MVVMAILGELRDPYLPRSLGSTGVERSHLLLRLPPLEIESNGFWIFFGIANPSCKFSFLEYQSMSFDFSRYLRRQ